MMRHSVSVGEEVDRQSAEMKQRRVRDYKQKLRGRKGRARIRGTVLSFSHSALTRYVVDFTLSSSLFR